MVYFFKFGCFLIACFNESNTWFHWLGFGVSGKNFACHPIVPFAGCSQKHSIPPSGIPFLKNFAPSIFSFDASWQHNSSKAFCIVPFQCLILFHSRFRIVQYKKNLKRPFSIVLYTKPIKFFLKYTNPIFLSPIII